MSVTITSTELKTRLGYYLDLLSDGIIIYITRNGKVTGKMMNAATSSVDMIAGILEGKLPDNYDDSAIKDERLETA